MKEAMKYLFSMVIALLLFSCGITIPALTGNYQQGYSTESSLSYDEAWKRVVDAFSANGIAISTIDKSSGIIVASKTPFSNSFTFEGKDGTLDDPSKFVVISKVRDAFGEEVKTKENLESLGMKIYGDWTVSIKDNGESVSVHISLLNLEYGKTSSNMYGQSYTHSFPVKSTGAFEISLLDLLK